MFDSHSLPLHIQIDSFFERDDAGQLCMFSADSRFGCPVIEVLSPVRHDHQCCQFRRALEKRYALQVRAIKIHREPTPYEQSFGAGYIGSGSVELSENQLRVIGEGYEAPPMCSEFDVEDEIRVQRILVSCWCLQTAEASHVPWTEPTSGLSPQKGFPRACRTLTYTRTDRLC